MSEPWDPPLAALERRIAAVEQTLSALPYLRAMHERAAQDDEPDERLPLVFLVACIRAMLAERGLGADDTALERAARAMRRELGASMKARVDETTSPNESPSALAEDQAL